MKVTGYNMRMLYSSIPNGTISLQEPVNAQGSTSTPADEEELRGIFPGHGWVGVCSVPVFAVTYTVPPRLARDPCKAAQ